MRRESLPQPMRGTFAGGEPYGWLAHGPPKIEDSTLTNHWTDLRTGLGTLAVSTFLIGTTLLHAQEAQPAPSLEQRLLEVRTELRLEDGRFGGSAAPVLTSAIAQARYVLIGEDHITREIPRFAAAVCDAMARDGLAAVAIEAGPEVGKFVSSTLGKPDRLARMAALTKKYPDSVAFQNVREENDFVSHCAETSRNPGFQVWGLDQEFLGSAGWLLDSVIATHPGPKAMAALTRMRAEERTAAAEAQVNGDPSKLLMMSANKDEVEEVSRLLKVEGTAAANKLWGEFVDSHSIYWKNMQRDPDSNGKRARLLKRNLLANISAAPASGVKPRVLLKFGDWHLYKGFNPLHQLDLGNFVAELADGQGSRSLHIAVLGAKGVHRMYAGYNRPERLEPFVMTDDKDYGWLKPLVENQVSGAWTVYDLRRLRFQKMGTLDAGLERLIYGYDLLVLVPELTPAEMVQ